MSSPFRSRVSETRASQYQCNLSARATMGQATFSYSFDEPDAEDPDMSAGFQDDEGNAVSSDELVVATEDTDWEDQNCFVTLAKLGAVDPAEVLEAIDEITEKYLTDVEGDLIWLMRQGRRPVEISRILMIPECEVVRLRRNCFRKIRVVFMYDYFRDKRQFVLHTIGLLKLNEKQARILTMFFDYYGLRPIAEVIGTRPSNIHRSLESIHKKLGETLAVDSEYRPFLGAFSEMKYLNLAHRNPN